MYVQSYCLFIPLLFYFFRSVHLDILSIRTKRKFSYEQTMSSNRNQLNIRSKSLNIFQHFIFLMTFHSLQSDMKLNWIKTSCITGLACVQNLSKIRDFDLQNFNILQVSYSLYFTDFVGEAVFHGDPKAAEGSESHALYEQGIRFGCWGMAMYSLSCACYSLIIEKLIKKFG